MRITPTRGRETIKTSMGSLLQKLININQFTIHKQANKFTNQIQPNLINDQFQSLESPQLQKSSYSDWSTVGGLSVQVSWTPWLMSGLGAPLAWWEVMRLVSHPSPQSLCGPPFWKANSTKHPNIGLALTSAIKLNLSQLRYSHPSRVVIWPNIELSPIPKWKSFP